MKWKELKFFDTFCLFYLDVDVEEFENDFDLPAPKKTKTDFISSKVRK